MSLEPPGLERANNRGGKNGMAVVISEDRRIGAFRRLALFADLPNDELKALAQLANVQNFDRHEVLFYTDDSAPVLYVLLEGRVKVSLYGLNGDETILNVLGPGDLLGELALFEPGASRSATAETVEPSAVLALQRTAFLGFLRAHPESAIRMLGTLATHVRRLSQLVDDAYHLGLEERLAKRLLDLAALHGTTHGNVVDIAVPLTQSELAGMLGATRESVNKLLRWYSSKGLIEVSRNQIRILQLDVLRRRAGERAS